MLQFSGEKQTKKVQRDHLDLRLKKQEAELKQMLFLTQSCVSHVRA